jgi:uncharacterized protein YceK
VWRTSPKLLLILAVCLLSGCVNKTPEQQAQEEAQKQAEGAAADDAKCRSYGLQPGTPEFEKCVTKLADLRAQRDYNDRAAMMNRLQMKPAGTY